MYLVLEDESHGTADDLGLLDGGSDWCSRVLPHDAGFVGELPRSNSARGLEGLRIELVEDSPYVGSNRPLSDAIHLLSCCLRRH
jgi:hypothetical protein